MQRTRLRNIYLKQHTEATKISHNQQRNKYVIIFQKSKRSYFECLAVKLVKDNKKFWKKTSPLFQTKLNQSKRSLL